MKSILITDSGIDKEATGGGQVGYNLALALTKYSLEAVLGEYNNSDFPFESINPLGFRIQGKENIFLHDYFALRQVKKYEDITLVQFYAGPFVETISYLKERGAKIVGDTATHNNEISRMEWKRMTGRNDFPPTSNEPVFKLAMAHYKLADVMITHSQQGADYVENRIGVECRVIPHGHNPAKEVAEYPVDFVVGHLSQVGPDKGQIYLIEAAKQTNTKLIMGGSGTEMWRQYINADIRGRVEDKSEIFNNCSVYALPSVTEGFGITVLEAMSHKRPVIVAKGAGVWELIEDGKEGFIVPIRDVNAIADKIQYFKDNPSEISRMGKNAQKKSKMYTWDKIRKEYQKIYEELI